MSPVAQGRLISSSTRTGSVINFAINKQVRTTIESAKRTRALTAYSNYRFDPQNNNRERELWNRAATRKTADSRLNFPATQWVRMIRSATRIIRVDVVRVQVASRHRPLRRSEIRLRPWKHSQRQRKGRDEQKH